MAEVDDVSPEEAEQDEGLAPLGGIAPENAQVFDDQGALILPEPRDFGG